MKLRSLIVLFVLSRGGLIWLSALVAVIARTALWPLEARDLVIAGLIVAAWPTLEYIAHRWVLHEWSWSVRVNHLQHHNLQSADRYAMSLPIVRVKGNRKEANQ